MKQRSLRPSRPRPIRPAAADQRVDATPAGSSRRFAYGFTFTVAFLTWIVLSGRFDAFHLILGVLGSALVAATSAPLLIPMTRNPDLPGKWLRFIGYLPWLLYQIFKANLHVLYLAVHPRGKAMIDPVIIRFRSRLTSEMALFIFANSITLTPGTITVNVSVYGDFTVHAIDRRSARNLPGEMERRVAAIFGE